MPYLFDWRDTVMSEHGPDSGMTRYVLLALSLFMDQDGGSCWPSVDTLVERTGLSRPTVIKHLTAARSAGWIDRELETGSGQGWKRATYTARLPKAVKEVNHEGGKGGSPRQAEGGKADTLKVVKEVNSISSVNSPESREGAAVRRFMAATDSSWRLKPSVEEWAAGLSDTYPGIPIAQQILKAADWFEGKGRTLKAPHQAIHNWLGKADPVAPSSNGQAMTAAELEAWEAGL